MQLTKRIALTSIALLSLTACTRSNATPTAIATSPGTGVGGSPASAERSLAPTPIATNPPLTPAQHQQLTATDHPIVLPNDLPADFRITDVITNVCPTGVIKPGCREGSSYTIVYRNPKNTCLLVNAIGGGVGGGSADLEFRTRSRLLGEVIILIGNQSGNNAPPNQDDMQTGASHLCDE
jgi:hypothetical protein